MARWGIPNWREPAPGDYPTNWNKLGRDKQKWEFLRRRGLFRKQWLDAVEDWQKEDVRKACGLTVLCDPKWKWKELPKDFGFIRTEEIVTGGKVIAPLPPVPLSEDAKKNKKTHEERFWENQGLQYPSYPDWYDLRVWVEFDLSEDIGKQLKCARKNIRDVQKQVREFAKKLSNSLDVYSPWDYPPPAVKAGKSTPLDTAQAVRLLRIHDAKNAGCSAAEIADVFAAEGSARNDNTLSESIAFARRLWRLL